MKQISSREIKKLTPKDILGFRTGSNCKGFVQATKYIGRHEFTSALFNFTAVEAINFGNYFSSEQTWPQVQTHLRYYCLNSGSVHRFDTEKELMTWLGQN